ncbi:MAG: VanZ family protein [Bacteroidales bacterium]|nr:VanZ family protein [Bacteroidales bacterium]
MTIDNATFFAAVEAQLAEGLRVRMLLNGRSMEPLLHEGEVVVVAPVEGEVAEGEVVLFRYRGRHLLHRVVAMEGSQLTLQGDNCIGCEVVQRNDVVARLVEVPRLGAVGCRAWQKASRRSLWHKRLLHLGRPEYRRWMRMAYFLLLAFFMWAPVGGMGVHLDHYFLGIRTDRWLHALAFLPCVGMLYGVVRRRGWLWVAALGIGVLAECVQAVLPWRGFDWGDMLANATGVSLGWVVTVGVLKLFRR